MRDNVSIFYQSSSVNNSKLGNKLGKFSIDSSCVNILSKWLHQKSLKVLNTALLPLVTILLLRKKFKCNTKGADLSLKYDC